MDKIIQDAVEVLEIKLAAPIACRPNDDDHVYVVAGERCCCGELPWSERNRPHGRTAVVFVEDKSDGI